MVDVCRRQQTACLYHCGSDRSPSSNRTLAILCEAERSSGQLRIEVPQAQENLIPAYTSNVTAEYL
jgi:hypothetical protein